MQESLNLFNQNAPWFIPTVVFIIGACIGSFLNVCIYRIPEGKSLSRPASHCYSCGKPIPLYLNIPIFAWLILRGKAHCCGAKFSFRYPLIELTTAVLFTLCWFQLSDKSLVALIGFTWISFMICVTMIDLDHMIIPDRFSAGGFIIGVIAAILVPELHEANTGNFMANSIQSGYTAILGGLVGSAIILWIMIFAEILLKKEAMGFGDVKLMGAIGAFCGWQGAIFSIFGGAVLGTIAIALLQVFKAFQKKSDSSEEKIIGREIPFGPMLASGSLLYFLFLSDQVDYYFSSLSWIATGIF